MGMFNYLILTSTCPRCSAEVEMEAEFRFGLMDLTRYRIGDQIHWDGQGTKIPRTRPKDGKYNDEAYVVCPDCKRDFWLEITVRNDVIVSAAVNETKQPYIPNDMEV